MEDKKTLIQVLPQKQGLIELIMTRFGPEYSVDYLANLSLPELEMLALS